MHVRLKVTCLRDHIVRRNISQNGFALKAGISSAYMAQILNGRRSPAGPVRQKLIDATGMSFDDLFEINQ